MIDNKKIISHLIYIFDLTTNDLGVIIRSDGRVVCHESQFEDFLNNRGIILESYSSEVAYHIEWSAASAMLKPIKKETAPVVVEEDPIEKKAEFILCRGGRTGRKSHCQNKPGNWKHVTGARLMSLIGKWLTSPPRIKPSIPDTSVRDVSEPPPRSLPRSRSLNPTSEGQGIMPC